MEEYELLEKVANLVLQSVMVWEDLHELARSLSSEYTELWALLDGSLRSSALKIQKQNRTARHIPFSLDDLRCYEVFLTKDGFSRAEGLHRKEQLKIILADRKFRVTLSALNDEIRAVRGLDYDYHSSGMPDHKRSLNVHSA
jgi:hypothetical protein